MSPPTSSSTSTAPASPWPVRTSSLPANAKASGKPRAEEQEKQENIAPPTANCLVEKEIEKGTRNQKQITPQPATPLLPPREDVCFVSPSPLRIRDINLIVSDNGNGVSGASGGSVAEIESGVETEGATETENGEGDKEQDKKQDAVEKLLTMPLMSLGFEDVGGNAVVAAIAAGDREKEKKGEPEIEEKDLKSEEAAAPKTETFAPAPRITLNDNENETQSTPANASSSTSTNINSSEGKIYLSPSDAILSPCTQKLDAFKKKKLSRGGGVAGMTVEDSGPRRLFGGKRKMIRGEKGEGGKCEDGVGEKQKENEK